MQWRKSPPELVALFDAVFPGPPAERRLMFGYPAGFVNGNMFMSLFQDDLALRLGDADLAALLALEGARPFEPMPGRPMRDYAVVPAAMHEDRALLASWVARALAHGAGLPAKAKKPAAPKKARA